MSNNPIPAWDLARRLAEAIDQMELHIRNLEQQLREEHMRCKLAQGSVEVAYQNVLQQLLDCSQQSVRDLLKSQTEPHWKLPDGSTKPLRKLGEFRVGDKVAHKRGLWKDGEVTRVNQTTAYVRRFWNERDGHQISIVLLEDLTLDVTALDPTPRIR